MTKKLLALTALAALAMPTQADAHCVRHQWYVRQVCNPDWNFTCHQHYVKRCVRWGYDDDRYDRPERVYGYERREERDYTPKCRPLVVATGHEAYGRTTAKEEGEQAWMEEVRGKWGARYMDPRNSHEFSYECYRSATGNRGSEKASDVVGKVLEQCRVAGLPCRAEKEYASDDREPRAGEPGPEVSRNIREDDEHRGSRLFRRFQEWRRRHPRG